jgi:alanyl-tRNA synthetase
LNQLAAELTTGYWEIPTILEKLRDENKALRREVRDLRAAVLEAEAESLWMSADRAAGYALIVRAFVDRDPAEVRQLVQNLIARPSAVVLCGIVGDKAQLITARSENVALDMVPVLKRGLAVWGVDRGGGRPSLAQGGGVVATLAEVEKALAAAAQGLTD